jgi:hypothetical protein
MTLGSAILDTPATNAHEMHGCIYVAYVQRFGGPGGQFAYPWTDEQEAPGGTGRVNYMSGQECSSGQAEPRSAIYYSNQTGQVWGVKGCVFRAYQSVGGPSDAGLGYPTSLEYGAAGGTVQAFQHGYILGDEQPASAVTASARAIIITAGLRSLIDSWDGRETPGGRGKCPCYAGAKVAPPRARAGQDRQGDIRCGIATEPF